MTVQELILILKHCPQNATIVVSDDECNELAFDRPVVTQQVDITGPATVVAININVCR